MRFELSWSFLMGAGMAYSTHSPPGLDNRSGLGTKLQAPVVAQSISQSSREGPNQVQKQKP